MKHDLFKPHYSWLFIYGFAVVGTMSGFCLFALFFAGVNNIRQMCALLVFPIAFALGLKRVYRNVKLGDSITVKRWIGTSQTFEYDDYLSSSNTLIRFKNGHISIGPIKNRDALTSMIQQHKNWKYEKDALIALQTFENFAKGKIIEDPKTLSSILLTVNKNMEHIHRFIAGEAAKKSYREEIISQAKLSNLPDGTFQILHYNMTFAINDAELYIDPISILHDLPLEEVAKWIDRSEMIMKSRFDAGRLWVSKEKTFAEIRDQMIKDHPGFDNDTYDFVIFLGQGIAIY